MHSPLHQKQINLTFELDIRFNIKQISSTSSGINTIKQNQMSWTNNTTIFLNNPNIQQKMKENCFLLHGRKKWVGKKTNFILCSCSGTTHFASLFVSSSWKRSAIKFPQKKFFCAEVVNPLATIVSFNSENVLLLVKLQYLKFKDTITGGPWATRLSIFG